MSNVRINPRRKFRAPQTLFTVCAIAAAAIFNFGECQRSVFVSAERLNERQHSTNTHDLDEEITGERVFQLNGLGTYEQKKLQLPEKGRELKKGNGNDLLLAALKSSITLQAAKKQSSNQTRHVGRKQGSQANRNGNRQRNKNIRDNKKKKQNGGGGGGAGANAWQKTGSNGGGDRGGRGGSGGAGANAWMKTGGNGGGNKDSKSGKNGKNPSGGGRNPSSKAGKNGKNPGQLPPGQNPGGKAGKPPGLGGKSRKGVSFFPTYFPTYFPTQYPTPIDIIDTEVPTPLATYPTLYPTMAPTLYPTITPTFNPTFSPTAVSLCNR